MRGIELPAGTEDKKNSGGFYVANGAVFTTDNPTRDWDMFTAFLGTQIKAAIPELRVAPHFEETEDKRRVYVFAGSDRMKVILDGQDEYIAVFLTAEDNVQELVFNTCLEALRNILVFGYTGSVFKRINYRTAKEVKDERL